LDEGIALFNHGEYFQAHEAWEKEWRALAPGEEKSFLQGLIMTAGAFLHYRRSECAGARELLERSIVLLRSGTGRKPEIAVAEFIGRLERLRSDFEGCSKRQQPLELPIIRRELVNRYSWEPRHAGKGGDHERPEEDGHVGHHRLGHLCPSRGRGRTPRHHAEAR
jgi:hypothetical protein